MSNTKDVNSIVNNYEKLLNQAITFIKNEHASSELEDFEVRPMGGVNDFNDNCTFEIYKKNSSNFLDFSKYIFLRISYENLYLFSHYTGASFESSNKWQKHLLTCDDKELSSSAAVVIKEKDLYKKSVLITENAYLRCRKNLVAYIDEENKKDFSAFINDCIKEEDLKSCCLTDELKLHGYCNEMIESFEQKISENSQQIKTLEDCVKLCNDVLLSQENLQSPEIAQ